MASRPRTAERPHGNRGRRGRGGARERAREGVPRSVNRVQEILSMCPESMGSGLLVDDTESGRVHRGHAVAKIKGLLGQIKANIQDPDLSLCADLQRVAELRQTVFREPELLEAVSEILVGKGVKTSIQPSGGREEPRHAQAAVCAILLATLKALPEWPVAIVEVYMHDALGGRHWASHSACKLFVDNLRTAWAPPPPLPAPSAAPSRALIAVGGDAELSSGKKGESDLKGKSGAEAEGVIVAPSTTAKIIAAGLHPSSGAAGGGGRGGGSDVGDDSSSSDGEMIVEEGGHVETVLPATSVGGGRGSAAAVAAATAAAKALARRREQETNTFSGFEKISLDGEDEDIPTVSDRFARNRAAVEKAIVSALHERFGRSFGEVLEKQRDRRIMGWAQHEKKTEWQVVLAATELSTLTAVRAFVAPHLNRWLNSPAFKDMASDLLQVLVQRVDPALAAEGDGVVVDAILSIDTDRPSLKPLYRSAVQELLRRHPKFSSRVLESSLVAVRGVAGKDLKKGGMDPGIASSSSSDGPGGAHHKAVVTVTATERTKTVLACLFEALGAKRATQEVAKVLCALSAGTAEVMTHFTAATVEDQERGKDDASVAARVVAPQALLPVLTSLPERSVDVVSIALEVLEIGQSAADALARGGGARDGGKVVFSVAADAAGRDLSYLASLSGPSLRRWAAILSASVREMVLWRARGDCKAAKEADIRRKAAGQVDSAPSAAFIRKRSASNAPNASRIVRGITMRSVRVKFAKDMAPIHRAGLLWCEQAAPSLLLAGEPDRDYSSSGDGRRGGLWRDCLTIVRNLTLLNGNHGVGSGASTGGMTRSVSADNQGDDSTEARGPGLLCDQTAVLEGEGIRSALRLAAYPVNAPAAELLGLLEALVLRAARSRLMFKTSSSISSAAPATPHGSGSSAASGGGSGATPKRPRLAMVTSPPSLSPPGGRSAHPASVGGGGGRARSGSTSGVGVLGVQVGGGSGVVPRHVGATGTALGAGAVGPMSAVMLTVTNADVEKGILTELFNLSSHKVPRKRSSSTSVMAMHNFVDDVTTETGTGAAGDGAKKSSGFWGDVLRKEQQPRGGKDSSRPGEGRAGSPRDSGGGSPRGGGTENIPRLARSELFWRAAVVALVLGATNPGSVGRQLWEASPTMRCLMQMLVCTDFRFPPPGGAVSLHGEGNNGNSNGGDGGGGRARLDSEDASGSCPDPSSITGPRRPGGTEGVSTEEAPSKSSSKSSSSSRRRRASEDDRFSASSFFPIQGAGGGARRSRRGSGTVDDDDEADNRDGPGGTATVDGGRGPGSGSGGAGLEGGEEMMVAADERVRREERAAVDRYYGKRARRHRKPPPPPRPPKRKRAPEPVQVSKRGRRLVKTIKQVEQPESSEEEELALSAQDQDESDPEDFPPGAPEIRYADFIKLDIGMPARRPPDNVLRTVEELDRELGLGAELRRCTRPDFITQVVAGGDPEHVGRKSVERSAKWLVSAVASEPEALLRRLPLAVTVHLLLLACHQAYEEDHARRAKEVVSASSAATTAASSSSSAAVAAVPASTPTPTSSRPAATAPSTAKQPPPLQSLSTAPARHGHHRRSSESALLGPRGPGSSLADVVTTTTSTAIAAETVAATVESSGARGMGWAGLFDGPPPSRVAAAGGGRGPNASIPTHHRRETPRLRWLARALRDSVAERVWAAPTDGSGGEGAVEAMRLLLDDLAHSYQGRRESARRALQSVLAPPPEGHRGSSGGIARARRVAWTPEKRRQPSLEHTPEIEEGEERVVVLQQEADEEQCGWLFWCRDIPAWENVAPLVVRSVRESIFYETSADPIRFSLLGLDLITRQPLRQTTPSSSPSDETPASGTSAGREKEVEEGGTRQHAATVARRQDRWFFTLLLCKLLSGRRMVASNTLQRYPETFDLAASAVNAALRGATVDGVDLFAEGSVWPPRPRTRFPSLDASTGRVKTVLLPPLLLETAIALLSFHRADAGLTQELKELQELVFPTEQPTAPPEASRETGARGARGSGGGSGVVGAGAAKMEASAKDAVGVKLWVRLAQAPSQQMSALAARHIPKMLLPRLLLASGLSRSCVRVTLSRLDSLGRAADNADELYQYLISPDAQGTWDMGNTMQSTKSLRDKLSRRVRAYLCTDDGDAKDDKDPKVKAKAKAPHARGPSGGDKKGDSEEGMFVAWLVEPPRQSGAGERGSGRAAAQAAAQEQQQRKVAQMFLLADAPATSTTAVSSSKKNTTKSDSGSKGKGKGRGRGSDDDIPGTVSSSSGGGEAASPGKPSPSKGSRSSKRNSAAAAKRKGDDEEKDVRAEMSGGGPVGGVDGDHTLGVERETGGSTAGGGGATSEKENTIRVSVYRCLSREEENLKQLKDEVDASATVMTKMARAKAGGDLQGDEGVEKERLGGGKGLVEEWLWTHLMEALRRAEDGVKDVLVTLRALESWRMKGLSALCEGESAFLLSIASPPRPPKAGAALLDAKATSHGTVRPLENGSAESGGTSGGVSLARRYEEALRATERVEEVFRRAKVVALQVLVASCSTPFSLQQQRQQQQRPKAEGGGQEGASGASGGKGRGKHKKNPNTNNATSAINSKNKRGKGDRGGSGQGDGGLESGVDRGELVLATSGGGGGWQAGFALRRAQQAIVDFVLSDPEDETVWKGILHGIPLSTATPPSDHQHHRHQRMYTCTLYWRSVLLEGALRACTPDAAEKRLRSALRTSTSRGDHAGGRSGTEADMEVEEAGAVVGTPVEKVQGEAKSETAVLMLTGLCRLARDWRVFARGPVVGAVGSADSLEAWARPYFHQRDAEGSPRAALDPAGWGSRGDSSPGSQRSWMAFSPAEVKELVKLVILGAGMKAKTKAEAESVSETEARVPVESAVDAGSERRESRRLQSKKHDTASEDLGDGSPDAAASAVGASDAATATATVNAACDRTGGNDSGAAVPVAWAWLLLTACSGKRDNLAAAVEDLVAARGGPDLVEDEEDLEDEDHDDEEKKSEGEEAEEGEAGDVDVSETVKVDVDADMDMEDQEEEDEIASSKPSDDADADAEDDADGGDNAEEIVGDDADDNAEEVMEEEEEEGDDVEEEKGDDEDEEKDDDDEENDKEQVEVEDGGVVKGEEPKVEGGDSSDNDDNNKSDNGARKHVDGGKFSERERRRAARAAAGYLLYQLYMTAPVEFEDCVGPEMHSRLLPVLADQFVVCAPPVPSEAGRGHGLAVAMAAHALAGVGLIAGEKGTGRKRAAASAAVHSAVLADVARRMPLVFLEQLPVLTEVLMNDAEVERSAAAATISTKTDEPATVVEEDHTGVAGGRPSGAGATVFRSRRIAPTRLCPVPALLRSAVVDTDGRPVGDRGDKILVHVRIWGQYFTEVAWRGVLGGLRAAPASIVGGAAGRAASVQRLLEAFLNIVAVQLMMDNGPELALVAVELLSLLETLGEMGASLLSAAPPVGGGPWSTARDMLFSIPSVIADRLMRNGMK